MIIRIDCPIASSGVYPNNRAAPAFHERICPSSVLLTMASSDDSTIAASNDGTSSVRSPPTTAPCAAATDFLTRRAGIDGCLEEGIGRDGLGPAILYFMSVASDETSDPGCVDSALVARAMPDYPGLQSGMARYDRT